LSFVGILIGAFVVIPPFFCTSYSHTNLLFFLMGAVSGAGMIRLSLCPKSQIALKLSAPSRFPGSTVLICWAVYLYFVREPQFNENGGTKPEKPLPLAFIGAFCIPIYISSSSARPLDHPCIELYPSLAPAGSPSVLSCCSIRCLIISGMPIQPMRLRSLLRITS
jgi:hypothetical protein